jgi:hypothetical protein
MESIDLSTENPLDVSFLNISLEETVHTTKYDSYQCDICQKKLSASKTFPKSMTMEINTSNSLYYQGFTFSQDFETISHFCGSDFF